MSVGAVGRRRPRRLAIAGLVLALAGCAGRESPRGVAASPPGAGPRQVELEFLGMAVLPAGLELDGVPVGGLSGLSWEAGSRTWLAVCDDAAVRGPARVYRLAIELDEGRLTDGGVRILETIEIRDSGDRPYPPDTVDPEGIAVLPDGTFFVSSEGNARAAVPPFVRHFRANGTLLGELPLPSHLLPDGNETWGIRQNTGPEALGLTPDAEWLFAAIESALAQDGPFNDPQADSLARLLRFDRRRGELAGEHLYLLGPLPARPHPADGIAVKGITELIPLSGHELLVLERAYVEGHGNTVELFIASLTGAADVSSIPSLAAPDVAALRHLNKRRLLDFATLGVPVDNLEGMALGPRIADGRRLLVVVSDDNFNPVTQRTQFLAFALALAPRAPRPVPEGLRQPRPFADPALQ